MVFLALQVPEYWVHILKKPGSVQTVFLLDKTKLEDFMSLSNIIATNNSQPDKEAVKHTITSLPN